MAQADMEDSRYITRIDFALYLVVAFLSGSIVTTLITKTTQPTNEDCIDREATQILIDAIKRQRENEWRTANQSDKH